MRMQDETVDMLIELVKPIYRAADAAHGIEHVSDVVAEALEINRKLNLKLDDDALFVAALYHDFYCALDRKNHHVLGANYVKVVCKYLLPGHFTMEQVGYISRAIEEHRASYDGNYSSMYSIVLSAADRGKPNLGRTIKRAKQFDSTQWFTHLVEKFGRHGYQRLTPTYKNMYADELEEQYDTIDRMAAERALAEDPNETSDIFKEGPDEARMVF